MRMGAERHSDILGWRFFRLKERRGFALNRGENGEWSINLPENSLVTDKIQIASIGLAATAGDRLHTQITSFRTKILSIFPSWSPKLLTLANNTTKPHSIYAQCWHE